MGKQYESTKPSRSLPLKYYQGFTNELQRHNYWYYVNYSIQLP